MNDAKIDELCQRIYKNHRQALDLIFEKAGALSSGILADVESAVTEDKRWAVVHRSPSYVDFLPAHWLEVFPALTEEYVDARAWLACRFEVRERRLDYYVELKPMSDVTLRRKIAESLLASGTKFGFERKQTRQAKDNYTRVSGRERVLEWTDDGDPDPVALREKVSAKLNAVFPRLENLPATLFPLIASGDSPK